MSSAVRLGSSAAIREVEGEIGVAAGSALPVLISGEPGVGKQIVARLVHQQGPRAGRALVPVRCGGVPEAVLGVALFGHDAGLDAGTRLRGALELANGGSIFLKDIGGASHTVQARLQQFLDTGEVRPIGAERPMSPVDVRVISSTVGELFGRVVVDGFDDRLFYRLNVLHIRVPPLRDRPEDVVPLMNEELDRSAAAAVTRRLRLSAAVWRRLTEHRWPGNLRELQHVARHLVEHARRGRADVGDLPEGIADHAGPRGPDPRTRVHAPCGSSWWAVPSADPRVRHRHRCLEVADELYG